ncbi:tripartite tricarboxylate transporter TctB family protein [Anaerotalea alkaliphila]|uniref:Tripartite tricarboxylate transporter TctB family protein n=1 Tax=Anaerotalea alkaliphila TaxID=2662126 RepID=A0A7X5HVN4_9FIRM|nr:tripartite tricarboxylate transporter TctB family protein [Anaerotalea alkaliphila]NDL67506.1 tripartite tricarboxylate transporter TctB family protein [Anaerotalea alkaliphila]
MEKMTARMLLPVATLLIGATWLWLGIYEYGFWLKGPGGGFFPAIVGGLMILASVVSLFQEMNKKGFGYKWVTALPLAACVLILVFSQVFGMLVSVFVYLIGWLKLFEKYSWKSTIAVSAGTMAFIYGAFVKWLQIPFPKGLVFQLLQ